MHIIYIYTLIFKRALISGCLLVRICFWQIERIFPSRAEICQTSTSWVFTACRWFKKTGRTTSAISRKQAQFPANKRTFEKWLFSNLTVPRAEIGKTSRFGFLEQKFAPAEISVLLKLQVLYIYNIYTCICIYIYVSVELWRPALSDCMVANDFTDLAD